MLQAEVMFLSSSSGHDDNYENIAGEPLARLIYTNGIDLNQ